jgi:hypothetical protein
MLYLSSTSPLRQADGWNLTSATKDFENIVELAISAFFGSSTKTLNFGFPSQFGRPADFPNAVAWLAGKLGIKLGSAYRSPRRKDGGVDIFVWKNFPDSFGGKPVGLVQATIMEDFRNKIADIDTKLWSSWLAIDTDPLVVLAIPTIENDRNIWSELSSRGTLLDRRRLAQMQPEGLLYENTRLELALADFEGTFL